MEVWEIKLIFHITEVNIENKIGEKAPEGVGGELSQSKKIVN